METLPQAVASHDFMREPLLTFGKKLRRHWTGMKISNACVGCLCSHMLSDGVYLKRLCICTASYKYFFEDVTPLKKTDMLWLALACA